VKLREEFNAEYAAGLHDAAALLKRHIAGLIATARDEAKRRGPLPFDDYIRLHKTSSGPISCCARRKIFRQVSRCMRPSRASHSATANRSRNWRLGVLKILHSPIGRGMTAAWPPLNIWAKCWMWQRATSRSRHPHRVSDSSVTGTAASRRRPMRAIPPRSPMPGKTAVSTPWRVLSPACASCSRCRNRPREFNLNINSLTEEGRSVSQNPLLYYV